MDSTTIFKKLAGIDVTPYIKSKNPKVDVNDPKAPLRSIIIGIIDDIYLG